MRHLHIIMPMAGEGLRFRNAGYSTPKPLIEIKGKPLFLRAVESVKINDTLMKYSFIVRKEHIDKYKIDKTITYAIPKAKVYSVNETTRGAVETCLVAEQGIDDNDAIIIMDCDLEFQSKDYNQIIMDALRNNNCSGGALVSFNSNDPKYSYAEIDENSNVIRTAEKDVISNHALCGAYFFASGKEFKTVAHKLLNEPTMLKSEFYISLLFNYLLANGDIVKLVEMEEFRSFGTPDELKRYSND